jgi:hypothetical protein
MPATETTGTAIGMRVAYDYANPVTPGFERPHQTGLSMLAARQLIMTVR